MAQSLERMGGQRGQLDSRLGELATQLADGRDSAARVLLEKLIPDFREPDNIRLGIAPLYTRYIDLWETAQRLRRVVEKKSYTKYPSERGAVT